VLEQFLSHPASPSSWLRKNLARILSIVLFCAVLPFLFTPRLAAQVGSSDIIGTITDTSGAVVPGATVTLRNLDTGAQRAATSNESGYYAFSLVPNARYSVTVAHPQFKTFALTELDVTAGIRARADATLEPGVVTEQVKVNAAEEPILQTDTSNVGSTVTERAVQDIPLNGRNITAALQAQPGASGGFGGGPNSGASQSSGQSLYDRRPTSTVVVNGQIDLLNNHLIDGFDNNERQSGLIGLSPSLDGTAEVKVDTTNYLPEYGRTAGGVINVITKGGTNTFHGSVYEYFRNEIFDARDAFDTTGAKPRDRLNNFGGSIGGPIFKDRTFFFADVEASRAEFGQTYTSGVPTAYERAHPGDLSDDGGPVIPAAMLNPISLNYFALFPLPNLPGATNNYLSTPNETQNSETYDLRIDHRFSANNLFFARYAQNPVTTVYPEPFPEVNGIYPGGSGLNFPGPSIGKSYNLQLDFVHIFTPSLLVDLKTGYTRVNIQSLPFNYGKNASSKLGIPNVSIPGLPDTNVLMAAGGPADQWSFLGDALSTPLLDINNTFQYSGAVDYTHGPHSIKVGAGLIRRQVDIFQDAYAGGFFIFVAAPPYFDPRANFLSGNAIVQLRQNSLDHPGFRAWEPSFYAQDNWRVNARLTLNFGIRYDVFTPFTEKRGRYVNFNPANLGFILGTQNSHIGVSTDYHDIAPRIGFAYSINDKTVIRGAFGLSFFPPDIGIVSVGGAQGPVSIIQNYNPPYSFNYFAAGPSVDFSAGPVVPTAVDLNTYMTNPNVTSLSYKPFNLHSAYVEQYNLSVQRAFGGNTFTLAGVGVLGQDLPRAINLDTAPPPGAGNPTAPLVYGQQLPFVSSIGEVYNGSNSNYHALQVVYDRRAIHGVSVSANYTWSHGLADGQPAPTASDNGHPGFDYGNSPLDVPDRFAAYGSYKLPLGETAHGLKAIMIGGYQFNAIGYWQTSTPFTVVNDTTIPTGPYAGTAFINQAGSTEDRPNVIANVKIHNAPIGINSDFFNVNAFTPQTIGTIGNERVNQYFGPHDRRFDLSFFKDIAIRERITAQFRAECFNLTNTPNFAAPTATITAFNTDASGNYTTPKDNTPFGKISQTLPSETARKLQLAIKIIF
jgi:hypothetical protein